MKYLFIVVLVVIVMIAFGTPQPQCVDQGQPIDCSLLVSTK